MVIGDQFYISKDIFIIVVNNQYKNYNISKIGIIVIDELYYINNEIVVIVINKYFYINNGIVIMVIDFSISCNYK